MEEGENAVQAEKRDVGRPGFKAGWYSSEPARRPLWQSTESQWGAWFVCVGPPWEAE